MAHYFHFVLWESKCRITSNLRHPFFYKRNAAIGGQGKPATATQWVAARIAGRTTPEVRSVRHFMSARARHVYAGMINQHRKLKSVLIAPLRNFISGAAVCFPSNWSADSTGQSFEYHSSFGSTSFETGTKWQDCVLVVFFWTQYVYVCVCTSLLYSFHFVFLISSFLLSLFHYSFLPFFPSLNLFPSPSFVVPSCPLSASLFICLRFRKPFVIFHFGPPNGLPWVEQPKRISLIPLWT